MITFIKSETSIMSVKPDTPSSDPHNILNKNNNIHRNEVNMSILDIH